MKLTPSFFVQQPILRPALREVQRLFSRGQRIHLPGKFALQVCSLILVNDPFFRQFVDHGGDFRHLLTSLFLFLNGPQVADCIPRRFPVVLITIPPLFSLPYILFGCAMISHELDNFRTAKVRWFTRTTKSPPGIPQKSPFGVRRMSTRQIPGDPNWKSRAWKAKGGPGVGWGSGGWGQQQTSRIAK